MGSEKNEFLKVRSGVVLTATIEPVIIGLDPYFKAASVHAEVTSGLRTEIDQLRILRGYIHSEGLDKIYPNSMTCQIGDPIQSADPNEIFVWQRAWSTLLHREIIINPPRPAICLMDYFRGSINKKGLLIGSSPHIPGRAFDTAGDIEAIERVIQTALAAKLKGLKGYLLERRNNCVHSDCY